MQRQDKRVACLYRVSTKKQMEGEDIPMQKNACRAFMDGMHGWKLVKEYVEKGVSGYHKSAQQRDVLQQIQKDAVEDVFDILLVFMFDRLGRREDETPFIVEWLVGQGIEVWSVQEGRQRFEDRVDKLLNYIRFWQSGGESEKTSIRVREKHKQMVEEGKFRGGCAPFGYRLTDSDSWHPKGRKLKKLVVDEQESRVVQLIFKLAVNYGYGGYRIASALNERKLHTKHGRAWTSDAVLYVLKNPIYKGCYVSGKRRSERDGRKRVAPEEWIYAREVLEELIIVDEKIWNQAEAIRLSRKRRTGQYPYQTKGPMLLIGLARCGSCGMALTSRRALKKWTRKKDGKVLQYWQPQYLCRKKSGTQHCTGQRSYSWKKIDPIVLEEIDRYWEILGTVDISESLQKARKQEVEKREAALLALQREILKANGELEILNREMIKSLAAESPFTKEQLVRMAERKECEIRKLEHLKTGSREAVAQTKRGGNPYCDGKTGPLVCQRAFEQAPEEIQKMLLGKLLDGVFVYSDGIRMMFRFCLFDLKEATQEESVSWPG